MRFNSSTLPSDSARPPRASARSCSGSNLPLAFIRSSAAELDRPVRRHEFLYARALQPDIL